METPFFTDTHVHFHFPDFDSDREETLNRARAAGVKLFVNVGTDLASSKRSLEIARQHDDIYAAAGVHPHDAKDATPEILAEISGLVSDERVVAIGEVGLDFFRDHSPHDIQREVFDYFIDLHFETAKPLIIHCRDAYDELIRIFRARNKSYSGIIHCFSSGKEHAESLIDLGFYISFAGPLTYKKNDTLREACAACPMDRVLLETDAPFLPPQSMRGKRNESSFLLETARTAAEIRGISLQELASCTTANARRVFGL